MTATHDRYFDLTGLAEYTTLSTRTLRRHLKHPVRPLPAHRVGGRLLFYRAEVDAWICQQPATAPDRRSPAITAAAAAGRAAALAAKQGRRR